jgi:hypothetical protein
MDSSEYLDGHWYSSPDAYLKHVHKELIKVYSKFKEEEKELKKQLKNTKGKSHYDIGYLKGLWVMCSEFCDALKGTDLVELVEKLNSIDKGLEEE